MKHIYLLKLKQVLRGASSEFDYAFQSTAHVHFYLQDLWAHWQASMSESDWERIPPVPTIGELKAGLQAGTTEWSFPSYEILGIGFVEGDEPLNMVLILTKMPIY